MPFLPRLLAVDGLDIVAFILAAESLLQEAIAVLQNVGADLTACAREGVEGI